MKLSDKQKEIIIQGFIDYHVKNGAKSVLRESSPKVGVYIDNKFYSEGSILKPFIDKLRRLEENN